MSEFGNEAFVDFADALVLHLVATLVAEREQPPLPIGHSQRMRKNLEHEIPVLRAIAAPTQRSQRKGMCRAVSKLEPAFERVRGILRVLESLAAGRDEPVDLALRGRLGLQLADLREVFEITRGRHPSRSRRSSVAAAPAR